MEVILVMSYSNLMIPTGLPLALPIRAPPLATFVTLLISRKGILKDVTFVHPLLSVNS